MRSRNNVVCGSVYHLYLMLQGAPKFLQQISLLCPTRFTVRYSALFGLYQQFEVISDALALIEAQATENQV